MLFGIKSVWHQFVEWDKHRKFGCEFGDFLILMFLYLVVGLICVFCLDNWFDVVLLLSFVMTGLCNRRPPDM